MTKSIKILLAIMLLITGLFFFKHGTGSINAAQNAARHVLFILQEFVIKDIVGIV